METFKSRATTTTTAAASAAAAARTTFISAASISPRGADEVGALNALVSLPHNIALQNEAAAYLAQERAAEAASFAAAASTEAQHGSAGGRHDVTKNASIDFDGEGERVAYPPVTAPKPNASINPCTCSTALFDGWLRAVVVSIPSPSDSSHRPRIGDSAPRGRSTSPPQRSSFLEASQSKTSERRMETADAVPREHALYTVLELLEAASRLLQRRLALSHSQNRLLQAYYRALEEDIHVAHYAPTLATAENGLKPTAFHRDLRTRKREVPLQHYTAEQGELGGRLDKVHYVLRKLEEIEGLSNSVLVEGHEAAHSTTAASLHQRDSPLQNEKDSPSDLDHLQSEEAEGESPTGAASPNSAAPSRRLVAIERRLRRMRGQLNLPLDPADITSRLRNELILSFSARVLALREPPPFTPEGRDSVNDSDSNGKVLAAPFVDAAQDRHTHSISAFVEWYVQRVMDPLAISQLLSIVPHADVVTTSCRLVYACEAHASLRASRALPDLGAVLLRAVNEGRTDAMAQLVLSSSVSYGSALVHPVNNSTCFYAGLVGGQLEVVARLVEQQCWDVEALHALLFLGAPWGHASPTRGCYAYQKAMLNRVRRVLQLAVSGLEGSKQKEEKEEGDDEDMSGAEKELDGSEDAESNRDATVMAVAALCDAQLLDLTSGADGIRLLQDLSALFASAPFANMCSPAASPGSGLPSRDSPDTDSTYASPVLTRCSDRSFVPCNGGATVSLAWPNLPPTFLDGGLQKLRLLFAARNGMLQYESYQHNAQWSALLLQTTKQATALRRKMSNDVRGQTIAAQSREDGPAVEDGNKSSFAAVLQSKQLDAVNPIAACPVKCQMCPAFSTPSLQRVDALSYGPLQPTTAAVAATPAIANRLLIEEDDTGSNEEEAENEVDDDGAATETAALSSRSSSVARANNGEAQDPPVRALLLCADTAIERAPDAWQAYWCNATVVNASPTSDAVGKSGCLLSTQKDSFELARNPWRSSLMRLLTRGSARYSATHAIEDDLQAALTAKQRRAWRTLYGTAAGMIESTSNTEDETASDEDGGDEWATRDSNALSGLLFANHNSSSSMRCTKSPAARSIYFEVHLSLNYLLAMHDPALAFSMSSSDITKLAVSPNSVVVGLCDDSVAATANGCTRGPHQPYRVAHLGHTGDPTYVKSASTRAKSQPPSPTGSAGVSVSVVARYAVPASSSRFRNTNSETEVVFLAVSQHRNNSVCPITSEQKTPVYLRMEVPRFSSETATRTAAATLELNNDDVDEEGETKDVVSDVDSSDAVQHGSPSHATALLPTVTLVSPRDMREATAEAQRSGAEQSITTLWSTVSSATVVVGLLYTPFTDTLRFRLNNYIHPNELSLGMATPPSATDTESRHTGGMPACLFPAATLSLDKHGWERWYAHQTMMWSRAQQRRADGAAQGSVRSVSTRAGGSTTAGYGGSPFAQAVSNAVVRFAFEPTHLFYGPPLMVVAIQRAKPRAVAAPQKSTALLRRRPCGELIGLVDAACKFTQMLQVLTNVAALAGLLSGQRFQQQQQQSDDAPPGFGECGFAKSSAIAPAKLFFGSRDCRVRDALTYVQAMLNAPSAEGAFFYPPVRVYRHSSHCPPQDLYPLPLTSKLADDETAEGEKKEGATAGAAVPLSSMRRQLGGGPNRQPSLIAATAHLYWHEIIPENARLTPLCAALASRQPAMAYAICTHPLTSFCNSGNEIQNRLQQQQRRTALYAACALGYTDVVAVLLERIPVEEILSFFGLVIEGEARAALQHSYTKAEALFLRNYRLSILSAPAHSSFSSKQRDVKRGNTHSCTRRRFSPSSSQVYGTNECQRTLLDVSSIYSTTRSLYTPLHVALLGVIRESDDEERDSDSDEDVDEAEQRHLEELSSTTAASSSAFVQVLRGLRRQTACVTLLLNCLYDLLLVTPNATATDSSKHAPRGEVHHTSSSESNGSALQKANAASGPELLAKALNLQSRAGETALLLAVRHNNCRVATRLLKLGAQAACMDRVTHLFTLELACANRCTPMAEALLGCTSSPYLTSPVLLNHAGIATALCWCAINNMHTVLQILLKCDGIDVNAGFEGSTPLHLAITFGSEEAALALLNGTQPKMLVAASSLADGADRVKSRCLTNRCESGNNKEMSSWEDAAGEKSKRVSLHPHANRNDDNANGKPFMDVNAQHERTRCTALHLACERGQLCVVRALLQQWHAQLNIPAANTNYTPLLSALANGREDAALCVLEYSKDELRRGRAVLDLTAFDQNGDTALHLAARRGLVMAMEYMLIQFCEVEVARLAQQHQQLRASPAFLTATCIVPLHALNKQGKSALLVAIQYDQADAAEVLVSTLMDSRDDAGEDRVDGDNGDVQERSTTEKDDGNNKPSHTESNVPSSAATSSLGGPLIDGTCLALHQAFKKRLYSVVDLMLSTPSAAHWFPAAQAFREAMQQHKEARRGASDRIARIDAVNNVDKDDDKNSKVAVRRHTTAQNRSSFVRLLLTRAAGPTISPSGALHLLLGGFVLPELCVYLSDVAAESAVLGVQHGAAMAHAELLMGYLQEHAGLAVAPTRMVGFCRDVWSCLQAWMIGKAMQSQHQQQRWNEGKAQKRKSLMSFPEGQKKAEGEASFQSSGSRKHTVTKDERSDPPMLWLCRVFLPSAAKPQGGSKPHVDVGGRSSGAVIAEECSRGCVHDTPERCCRTSLFEEEDVKKFGEALRSAVNRKSLSLDIARAIRLYGRTAGGARAIEEIESLVRAYITARANTRSRQMRQRRTIAGTKHVSALHQLQSPVSMQKSSGGEDDIGESEALNANATTNITGGSIASAAAMTVNSEADMCNEMIGNELLFTTPLGFTVLQLAAALGLPEVTAFLVDKYKLDPLYAPSQDLYGEKDAYRLVCHKQSLNGISEKRHTAGVGGMSSDRSTSITASTSSPMLASLNAVVAASVIATPVRDEEDEYLYTVNSYTVRAMAKLGAIASAAETTPTSAASLVSQAPQSFETTGRSEDDDKESSSGGRDGSTWFYWTPYRLAVRTGNVNVVRTLLRTAKLTEKCSFPTCKKSITALLDKPNRKEVTEEEREEAHGAAYANAPFPHAQHNQMVDFKEPSWVDPFQRTALQEQIAVIAGAGSTSSSANSGSNNYNSSGGAEGGSSTAELALGSPGTLPLASHSRGRMTAALAAAADMVALLLRYGAQPNGLFDSTGSDAWMLALAGGGADGFACAAAKDLRSGKCESEEEVKERANALHSTPSNGTGVESCLSLLLRFRTPLLGQAPAIATTGNKTKRRRTFSGDENNTSVTFDEQLLRHRHTLLRKWKNLACMRGSSNSATCAQLATAKHQLVKSGAVASLFTESGRIDDVDEGGFVFDAAEALSELYSAATQHNVGVLPVQAAANTPMDGLFMGNAHQSGLASFLESGQLDANDESANGNSDAATTEFFSVRQTVQSPVMRRDGDTSLGDGSPREHSAGNENCKEKLIALLRLCYRIVLLYLCVDNAPQQLLRFLRVYTLDVVPVRARHPFSGDTVVTRLLRKARERLLTSGATPTQKEVIEMMTRAVDGVNRLNLIGHREENHKNTRTVPADQQSALSELRQPVYRDPMEYPGASVLIHAALALIHVLPHLDNVSNSDAPDCAILQSILFQPSFDEETALSLAACLAHVPLISSIVQSTASPAMLEEIASARADSSSKSGGRYASRSASREQREKLLHTEGPNFGLRTTTTTGVSSSSSSSSPSKTFSLSTNLRSVAVRMLLATRIYYPAHESVTVRILLRCMPDEEARLAFLRWVYPNIHPLPALQLAMDNADVAAYFLTTPDCMNALWTNLLYTHFTRQLDTAVHATPKSWNALLKVVLPGAPAVPVYLVLREALRTKKEKVDVKSSSGLEMQTASFVSARSPTSTVKRPNSVNVKKVELTNWSYLVRRTTIFLQLMSVSVAETLTGRTVAPAAVSSALSPATAHPRPEEGGGSKRTKKIVHDARDGMEGGANEAAVAVPTTPGPTTPAGAVGGLSLTANTGITSRGLAGTLLLDTLELAVRYDDKEVWSLLMQLRLPEIVIKYVQLVQQQQAQQQQLQQAANGLAFPAPVTAQPTNTRAIDVTNATIVSNYPSFAGVRSMTQASTILDRLQRLLWREAILERHFDLIAVIAGAVKTLRSFYTPHNQAEVASLLSPMRYDRIDVNTGNPEGVVSTAVPLRSTFLLTPQPSPSAEPAAVKSGKCFQNTMTLRTGAEVTRESVSSSSPPLMPKETSCSPALQEMEEEQRFMESCLQSDRLAPREERRRRVTLVTWGIAGSSCGVPLPTGRLGSISVLSTTAADSETAAGNAEAEKEREKQPQLPQLPQQQRPQQEQQGGTVTGSTASLTPSPGFFPMLPPPALLLSPVRSPLPSTVISGAANETPKKEGVLVKFAQSTPINASHLSSPAVEPAGTKMAQKTDLPSTKSSGNPQTTRQKKQPPRARNAVAVAGNGKRTSRVQMPTLNLPVTQLSTPAPPPHAVLPVYFMYLQLDWAMFSTRLLQSPQPSTATVDTILYLMEHRCALSVPVMDLFLSGLTVTASRFDPEASSPSSPTFAEAMPRQCRYTSVNKSGESTPTAAVELSPRYRTQRHRDTLLHLLVLHDQCQLAEYYLEYCYFFFVSHQIDPEPKMGYPGRFPIHEQLRQRSRADYKGDGCDTADGNGPAANSPTTDTPVAFLRMMLRVNAHGLTAFDYAHSPAMIQLLEWYGCVPPTYRPNPRLFRQVLRCNNNNNNPSQRRHNGELEAESPDEVVGWAWIPDEDDEGENNSFSDDGDVQSSGGSRGTRNRQTLSSKGTAKKKRALLQFFPVPRLVLASDNFVTLLDMTGTELAATAPQTLTTHAAVMAHEERENTDKDNDDPKNAVLTQRADRQQLKANRHLAALITAEKKQLQLTQRRRQQQELAKAMLFEQAAVQPLMIAPQGTTSNNANNKDRKSSSGVDLVSPSSALGRGRGPANPPYLTSAVTANLRERWDAQRHPYVSDNLLLHNALEAQRQSSLSSAAACFSGSGQRLGRNNGRKGGFSGVLPILLSEEVSLLHLGLCTFDDELVRMYGQLHASSSQQQYLGTQSDLPTEDREEPGAAEGKDGAPAQSFAATAPPAQLSAYSRMLLPPVLTRTVVHEQRVPSPQQQRQQQPGLAVKDRECRKARSGERDSKTLFSVMAPPIATMRITSALNRETHNSYTASAPPPPRLSHVDLIFLLECQQFVVFPLALPSVYDDDLSEDMDSFRSATNEFERNGSVPARGARRSAHRGTEEPQRGVFNGIGLQGPYDATAVIDRCTGGDSSRRETRSKSQAMSSFSINTVTVQPGSRVRSASEQWRSPANDAPLLRALFARQAATMFDLVDASPHRYDIALLVSLTPMQLSGVAGNVGRGRAAITMRALTERLTNTQFKQFGSRVVPTPGLAASSSPAHPTVETLPLLNVPPFVLPDTSVQTASLQRPALYAVAHAVHEDSASARDAPASVAAVATATASLPGSTSLTSVPTVMAARVEEWVARRWPSQRKAQPTLNPVGKLAAASADMIDARTSSQPPPSVQLSPLLSPSVKMEKNGKQDMENSLLPLPSALDSVAPIGGVATTPQQLLMKALLKQFSAATGAQLSDQMGLLITPNYDVEDVGDAAAAQRSVATKGTAPTPKKKR